MSYVPLARRMRPRKFQEVIGQPYLTTALVNSLQNKQLHHAYLFSGLRGVGKTTIARIFAAALNCSQRDNQHEPCGKCEECVAIFSSNHPDCYEIDAASRTKVEDMRELLENISYHPVRAKYKIYLIDEVHMLSMHSFNALLKTLEEPPAHVKFLFATTETHKVPATILSRCVKFTLQRIPRNIIAEQLAQVLTDENINYTQDAVNLVAKTAAGSMRDALNLLEQLIAVSHGAISQDLVSNCLGVVSEQQLYELLQSIAQRNISALSAVFAQLTTSSVDYDYLLQDFMSLLHELSLALQVPNYQLSFGNHFTVLLTDLSADDLQAYYQIALLGRKELPFAPSAQIAFEMILLRMAACKPSNNTAPPTQKRAMPEATNVPDKPAVTAQALDAALQNSLSGIDKEVFQKIKLSMQDNTLVLSLDQNLQTLLTAPRKARIEALAKQQSTQPISKLQWEFVAGQDCLQVSNNNARVAEDNKADLLQVAKQDPNIQNLLNDFDGQLIANTISTVN